MIAINERDQQNQPGGKELAREDAAPVKSAKASAESEDGKSELHSKYPSREIPQIRAAADLVAKPCAPTPPKEEKAHRDSKPAADEWIDQRAEKRLAGKSLGGAGPPLAAAPSQRPEGSIPAPNGPGSQPLDDSRAAQLPGGGMAGRIGAGMSKAGSGGISRKRGAYAANADLKGGQQVVQSASDVLVVYCDISPEAAKKKSFAKLLDANGIEWRRERTAEREEMVAKHGQSGAAKVDAIQRVHDESSDFDKSLKQVVASGKAELVYAEATPAQVRAALAGLEAQPNVFLSYSVKPSQDARLRQLVDRYYQPERGGVQSLAAGEVNNFSEFMGQARPNDREATGAFGAQPNVAGEPLAEKDKAAAADKAADNKKATSAEVAKNEPRATPPAAVGAPSRDHSQAKADTPPTDNASVPQTAAAKAPRYDERKQAEQQQVAVQPAPGQYYAQSPLRQRVLFVLRVGDVPAATAAEVQSAGTDSAKVQGKAKAAATSPAKSPPAEPAPSK
jgi:hypothetical protein